MSQSQKYYVNITSWLAENAQDPAFQVFQLFLVGVLTDDLLRIFYRDSRII
jgi:hypothetical protein